MDSGFALRAPRNDEQARVCARVICAAPGGTRGESARRSPALDLLEERYARGEINREEYLQKKGDILG